MFLLCQIVSSGTYTPVNLSYRNSDIHTSTANNKQGITGVPRDAFIGYSKRVQQNVNTLRTI